MVWVCLAKMAAVLGFSSIGIGVDQLCPTAIDITNWSKEEDQQNDKGGNKDGSYNRDGNQSIFIAIHRGMCCSGLFCFLKKNIYIRLFSNSA